MPSQILAIQPRRQDLRTQTTEDWTDAFPLYRAGTAGVVAGATNVGNGSLQVDSIDPLTPLGGHIVTVTGAGGITAITVTDPTGIVTGRGVAGAPLYAAGLTLTLTPGSVPFAVGDVFAVQPTPAYIDDTGIAYILQVRPSQTSPVVSLEARSAPTDGSTPTIIPGGGSGVPALLVPYTLMSASRLAPDAYVYELLALAEGRRKVAYFGNLDHVGGVAYLP